MSKCLIFMALSFVLILQVSAKPNITLKFGRNGQFKIVQFTDTHIDLIKGANLEVYETIRKVPENEKPDLIMLTGDVITQDDPQQAYLKLSEIFSSFKIPWGMVFGNHDSNTYSTLKPAVDGYGWFSTSQIDWYRNNSYSFTSANSGKPLPALAFFHIPLPEYTKAWNNKNGKVFGVKNEDECSPELNTGMFAAMVMGGDVMGTFVGHDHINDYIGVLNNVVLAYGRVTKKMKDAADPLAGGRVIVLKEGKREFDTWIREASGTKVLECSYPGSFVLKK